MQWWSFSWFGIQNCFFSFPLFFTEPAPRPVAFVELNKVLLPLRNKSAFPNFCFDSDTATVFHLQNLSLSLSVFLSLLPIPPPSCPIPPESVQEKSKTTHLDDSVCHCPTSGSIGGSRRSASCLVDSNDFRCRRFSAVRAVGRGLLPFASSSCLRRLPSISATSFSVSTSAPLQRRGRSVVEDLR